MTSILEQIAGVLYEAAPTAFRILDPIAWDDPDLPDVVRRDFMGRAKAALQPLLGELPANIVAAGEMAIFESQRAERKWAEDMKAKAGGFAAYVTNHSEAAMHAMIKSILAETP